MGTPVVSSESGAKGLAAEHRKHLLIANLSNPKNMANQIILLVRENFLQKYYYDVRYLT